MLPCICESTTTDLTMKRTWLHQLCRGEYEFLSSLARVCCVSGRESTGREGVEERKRGKEGRQEGERGKARGEEGERGKGGIGKCVQMKESLCLHASVSWSPLYSDRSAVNSFASCLCVVPQKIDVELVSADVQRWLDVQRFGLRFL
jgi:hypothetical protein